MCPQARGVVASVVRGGTLWDRDATFPDATRLVPREIPQHQKAFRQRRSGASGSRPVTYLYVIGNRNNAKWLTPISANIHGDSYITGWEPSGHAISVFGPETAARNEVSHERITRPCKTMPGLRCRACARADGRLLDRLPMRPLQN